MLLPPTMTRKNSSDSEISSVEEFEAELAALIEVAVHKDIDVRGAWEFRTGGTNYDWEVNIFELAKEADDDDD